MAAIPCKGVDIPPLYPFSTPPLWTWIPRVASAGQRLQHGVQSTTTRRFSSLSRDPEVGATFAAAAATVATTVATTVLRTVPGQVLVSIEAVVLVATPVPVLFLLLLRTWCAHCVGSQVRLRHSLVRRPSLRRMARDSRTLGVHEEALVDPRERARAVVEVRESVRRKLNTTATPDRVLPQIVEYA